MCPSGMSSLVPYACTWNEASCLCGQLWTGAADVSVSIEARSSAQNLAAAVEHLLAEQDEVCRRFGELQVQLTAAQMSLAEQRRQRYIEHVTQMDANEDQFLADKATMSHILRVRAQQYAQRSASPRLEKLRPRPIGPSSSVDFIRQPSP